LVSSSGNEVPEKKSKCGKALSLDGLDLKPFFDNYLKKKIPHPFTVKVVRG
jgi:hypothetical protein